ncbi:MAG: glycine cleavage system aminomethyltransferase GcvT [Alphaproteobacteria bacterium]|nr:glycine cleavage system aminomethyltransferase GcvT [Alphaproteobacteria bacterium]
MLHKTALHDLHKKLGAKMGEFAGYDMPLYYGEGVVKEHLWTREKAGLFDVSHMGQAMIEGPEGGCEALDLIQKLTPTGFEKLKNMRTKYTVLLNKEGGIIDDLMITRTGENGFHFVLNAGCKDKDMAWIKSHMPESCTFTYFDDWALLALQGPSAESVIRDVLGIDLSDLAYMGVWGADDYSMFISRLGYTGEDGFEISVPNDKAQALAEKLLAHADVKPIGLAARDSLRLEMGYALYGHDIDATTSPVEAGLEWVISKVTQGYFGYERIQKELTEGPQRTMIGLKLTEKGVAREGAEIRNAKDEIIGHLTAGGPSPSLGESIGQGYIKTGTAKQGDQVFVNVRGRNIAAQIAARPFLPASTKSAKKAAA